MKGHSTLPAHAASIHHQSFARQQDRAEQQRLCGLGSTRRFVMRDRPWRPFPACFREDNAPGRFSLSRLAPKLRAKIFGLNGARFHNVDVWRAQETKPSDRRERLIASAAVFDLRTEERPGSRGRPAKGLPRCHRRSVTKTGARRARPHCSGLDHWPATVLKPLVPRHPEIVDLRPAHNLQEKVPACPKGGIEDAR